MMTPRSIILALLVALTYGAMAWAGKPTPDADWPGFRGATGDGQVAALPDALPALKLLWSQPVAGECHAGVAVAAGVVVTPDGDAARDYYRCFDARTGTPRWVREFPNGRKMESGPAPRATPLVHAGRVYVLGAFGDLRCLDLQTGAVVWEKDYARDFHVKPPTWGFCTSPLVTAGKLIVFPKGPVALDPATGNVLWEDPGAAAGASYSTPIVATLGGVEQLVGFDAQSLSGWDLATGARRWTLPVPHDTGYIVPAPVRVGDRLLIAQNNDDARLLAFGADGRVQPKALASTDRLKPEVVTPVVVGDLIVGSCAGIVCLDAGTLAPLWAIEDKPLQGDVHLLAAGSRVLGFNEQGTLYLLEATRAAGRLLGKQKLCDHTLMPPAVAGGCVYVRDAQRIYCYELPRER